jgi:hypothetical protein
MRLAFASLLAALALSTVGCGVLPRPRPGAQQSANPMEPRLIPDAPSSGSPAGVQPRGR